MGPVLGRYLLLLLGLEQYVKPDTLLSRLLGRIGGWQPTLGNARDRALIQDAISGVAAELGTTPAWLDNALWFYESTGRASLPPPAQGFNPAHPLGPRSLAQASQLASRRVLFGEAAHAPLLQYVRELRHQVQGRGLDVPDLDPLSGGHSSRILYLLDVPGPAASRRAGSGLVSMDNADPASQTIFELSREAGTGRETSLVWAVVPWYADDVREVEPADVAEAREPLRQLLDLLPEVQVVVALGQVAATGWHAVAQASPQLTGLSTWSSAETALHEHPERRQHVRLTFGLAQHIADYAAESEGPAWARSRIHLPDNGR